MKNLQKGFVVPVLLVIIALLVIGGGVYIYQNKKAEAPAPVDNTETQKSNQIGQQTNTQTPSVNTQTNNSNLKIYTNTEQGYSFQYPERLSLSTSGEAITLSHSILFDNYNGGCDLKDDSVLSKTLEDFNLSIKIVSGKINPSYIDGSYSIGILNGKWAYMGAEGCGQINYYFPISGNRTLIVTKAEIQILSNVVSPEIKAKVMAIPGAISSEEAKIILNQILSTFKFSSSNVMEKNTVVKVYFAPIDSEQVGCADVVAVDRIVPKTTGIGVVALEELLKGPTAEEKTKGYTTIIPSGSKLNSLMIENGEARVDLNAIAESGGGSCSMGVRTTQIRQTLLQFPTIKTVTFSINGRTKDIFQP